MSERRTQSPKNLDSNSCVKLIAKVNKLNQSSKQSPLAGNFKSSSEVKLEYNTSTKWIATNGNKKMYHQSRQRDNLLPQIAEQIDKPFSTYKAVASFNIDSATFDGIFELNDQSLLISKGNFFMPTINKQPSKNTAVSVGSESQELSYEYATAAIASIDIVENTFELVIKERG